jgi:hypothetical protein
MFQENLAATLAASSKMDVSKRKEGVNTNTWTGVDSNPSATMHDIHVC